MSESQLGSEILSQYNPLHTNERGHEKFVKPVNCQSQISGAAESLFSSNETDGKYNYCDLPSLGTLDLTF